jgi:hypothetical protein
MPVPRIVPQGFAVPTQIVIEIAPEEQARLLAEPQS